ncbi:MAG: hypothetical protein M1337_03830, partial [Actinobacteria bacterium]|nr:hypothetical protein [Actinomycetota bacterium]
MQSSHSLDRVQVGFSDRHAVADAGLVLPATLAKKLGLQALFDQHVGLGKAPGAGNEGLKAMTLGTFLRAFTWSHALQLDVVSRRALARAWATGELTLRADAGFYAQKVVGSCRQRQVRFSITTRLPRKLEQTIAALPEAAWTAIPYVLPGAGVADLPYTPFGKKGVPVRLIVR